MVFDPDKSWHADFGSFEESHILDYKKSLVKDRIHIEEDVERDTVLFKDIWFTGLPDHHFFGVLVSSVIFHQSQFLGSIHNNEGM